MAERIAKKVLLIGWDSADWQFINPLLDSGLMPTLNSIVDGGVIGNLGSMSPALSPILWTSIATGKRPHKHGIHGFIEPRPDGQGVQQSQSTTRKCKAIWNILSQSGLRSNVVGWYASHPAEPINGAIVSNAYGKVRGEPASPTLAPPDAFHPRRLAEPLNDLAIHPSELTAAHVLPFIPKLGELTPEYQQTMRHFLELLADCSTIHAAATHLMQNEPWDFMAVFYDALDLFGHGFMAFHPPRLEYVEERVFEWFKDVMVGAYRFHDMMLQTLLDLAGPDTTVIVVSDHGFFSDDRRPRELPGTPVGPAAWHRSHGIVAMRGNGIQTDERVYGATLTDVTPTVLSLFGLPLGRDMDGKVIASAFVSPPSIEFVDSWDTVPGDSGMHPPDLRADPFAAHESLRQLADLGYISLPTGDLAEQVAMAENEAKFNLACALIDANQNTQAVELLRELYAKHPHEPRSGLTMALALIKLQRFEEARTLLEDIQFGSDTAEHWNLAMARVQFGLGESEQGMKYIEQASQLPRPSATLFNEIGSIHETCKEWELARQSYDKALSIDPDSATAVCGLGVVALYTERYEQAVELLLRAIGLLHFFPRAHYYLGVSLAKLGWWDRAIAEFHVCTRLFPRMVGSHRYLAAIYARQGRVPEAMAHQRRVRELIEQAKSAGSKLDPESVLAAPELPKQAVVPPQ